MQGMFVRAVFALTAAAPGATFWNATLNQAQEVSPTGLVMGEIRGNVAATAAGIPEPSPLTMFLLGLVLIGVARLTPRA
jgi:hypothetical protein